MRWGMLIDLRKCVGCYACTVACQDEHSLPVDIRYNKLAKVGPVGEYPNLTSYNITTACMHCQSAPCVDGCPTGASYHQANGAVAIDKEKCVGCMFCTIVCPYGARQLNKHTGIVEKCNLCVERLEAGGVTRCVQTCQLQARMVGNLDDPDSEIIKKIRKYNAKPLYEHLGTDPSVYYIMP